MSQTVKLDSARQKTKRPSKLEGQLQLILALELDALNAEDKRSLRHIILNNTRKLVQYGHAIFLTSDTTLKIGAPSKSKHWSVKSISGQGIVDRTSPMITYIENQIKALHTKNNPDTFHTFDLFTENNNELSEEVAYPCKKALWIPLTDSTALLFIRNKAWTDLELKLLERISLTYTASWKALATPKFKRESAALKRYWQWGILSIFLIMFFWPVAMTTLAPAEVIAAQPQIVSAPINGVIDKITVPPNSFVKKGDIIVAYTDTSERNEYKLYSEEVAVAQARLEQIVVGSFRDQQIKREMRVMTSELKLAKRRRDYAWERLQKTVIKADQDGLIIYADEDEWVGRPVSAGERILMIAQPNHVELEIEAPVNDGQLLQKEAKVKLFLDADPLQAVNGALQDASYQATPVPGGGLAYIATASFIDGDIPRIGARGVAKIYGEKAPLGFWLLRKPIVSLRQFLGI